ncbi:MAG: hypothetical protein ABJB98_09735 [Actinomycetota bacterium]
MSIAVLDIDGVVADVRHRLHHLQRRPKDWAEFFAAAGEDTVLAEGAVLAAKLAGEHDIVWLTGRPEFLRRITVNWLATAGLPAGDLVMRPERDRRPAAEFKLHALRALGSRGIAAVLDDDPEVIRAAGAAGLPAVLADWVPRGHELREAQDRLGRT